MVLGFKLFQIGGFLNYSTCFFLNDHSVGLQSMIRNVVSQNIDCVDKMRIFNSRHPLHLQMEFATRTLFLKYKRNALNFVIIFTLTKGVCKIHYCVEFDSTTS